MTQIGLKLDSSGESATLNGEVVAGQMQDGVLMLDAQDLVKRAKGRYSPSKETKTVDIYLLSGKASSAASTGGADNYLEFKAGQGEAVAQGKRLVFTDDNAYFVARFTPGWGGQHKGVEILVKTKDGKQEYRLEFAAKGNQSLRPGVYENALNRCSLENPGMEVSTRGFSHSGSSGRFEVQEIGLGPKQPTRFFATFTQNGGGSEAPLEGILRYNFFRR